MPDYKNKLATLTKKTEKLIDEKNKLIEKRKKEIGELASKNNLLEISDTLLCGVLIDLQQAIQDNNEKLQHWELLGRRFQKSTKT